MSDTYQCQTLGSQAAGVLARLMGDCTGRRDLYAVHQRPVINRLDYSEVCVLMISLAPEAHLAPALDASSPVDRQNASEP